MKSYELVIQKIKLLRSFQTQIYSQVQNRREGWNSLKKTDKKTGFKASLFKELYVEGRNASVGF